MPLADRLGREHLWRAVPLAQGGGYALQWFDPLNQEQAAGFVVLHELLDLTVAKDNPRVVSMTVADSTRAVKASGGRTAVSFACASPGDCSKYLSALNTLRQAGLAAAM